MRIYTKTNCMLCRVLESIVPTDNDFEIFDIETVVGQAEAAYDEVLDECRSMPIVIGDDESIHCGQDAIDYMEHILGCDNGPDGALIHGEEY